MIPRIAKNVRRLATRPVVMLLVAGAALLALVVPGAFARGQAVPSNTDEPTISGTPAQGQTLTATAGTWDGSPTSYSYQWVRCSSSGGAPDGSDCGVIGGATTTAYIVSSGDVGSRLRVRVTATNSDGSKTAASNATAVVTAAQTGPANTAPPTISGQAVVGQTLTSTTGTWTGSGITYAYAWARCDTSGSGCATISGATASTYKLADADTGKTIRVRVTAKNSSGSNSVTSAATTVVTKPSTPATGCPTGSGPIDIDKLSPPARLSIGGQRIVPSVVTPGTQTIRVSFRVTACDGRPVQGALVYATPVPYQQFSAVEQPTGTDGIAVLTMRQLRFFPASNQQQLLVIFARARNADEDVLGGVSTRRLFSFRVNLHG